MKDQNIQIFRDLIELLQINGFTVEKILEYGPSQIAEKLGIDDYVAQIIFNETTKEKQLISYNELYPEDQNYYQLEL